MNNWYIILVFSLSIFAYQIKAQEPPENKTYIDTSQWVDMGDYCPDIIQDIRYATSRNFVEEKMYDCAACYLRPEAALALSKVHEELQKEGLGVKVYDCYRPRFYQWKLWEVVPNPQYVADPRKGSIHNRGMAVDMTIVDSLGKELSMGTDYDYFGVEAYHDYTKHSDEILQNRKMLKNIMKKHGFNSIRTEWWHYNYERSGLGELSDAVWRCGVEND